MQPYEARMDREIRPLDQGKAILESGQVLGVGTEKRKWRVIWEGTSIKTAGLKHSGGSPVISARLTCLAHKDT